MFLPHSLSSFLQKGLSPLHPVPLSSKTGPSSPCYFSSRHNVILFWTPNSIISCFLPNFISSSHSSLPSLSSPLLHLYSYFFHYSSSTSYLTSSLMLLLFSFKLFLWSFSRLLRYLLYKFSLSYPSLALSLPSQFHLPVILPRSFTKNLSTIWKVCQSFVPSNSARASLRCFSQSKSSLYNLKSSKVPH